MQVQRYVTKDDPRLPHCHRVISLMKRWALGTHQGAISGKHLDYYLDEFTFRFNRRSSKSRGLLFYRLLEEAVRTAPVSREQLVSHMRPRDVMAVLDMLSVHGVVTTIGGGWGVDALLGRQTRTHGDLDLLISRHQLQHTIRALSSLGYKEVRRDDVCLVRLQDEQRRRVDLHLIDINRDGSATEQLPGGQTYRYTRESTEAPGFIGGYPVTCLSRQAQLLRHAGYRLRDDDRRDLRLLRDAPPTP